MNWKNEHALNREPVPLTERYPFWGNLTPHGDQEKGHILNPIYFHTEKEMYDLNFIKIKLYAAIPVLRRETRV